MSNFTFTADSITVVGKTFPAEYSVTKTGAVMVFVKTAPGAEPQRVRFPVDHEDHAAALAAYNAAEEAAKQEQNAAAQRAADAAKAAYREAAAKLEAKHEQDATTAQVQAPETPSAFPGWTGELHQGEALAKRLAAAGKLPNGQIHLDRKNRSAEIVSRGHTHTVTLKKCTCGDFIRYKMPCKHMYRLALDLGLLDVDGNADETAKPVNTEKPAETAKPAPIETTSPATPEQSTAPVHQDVPSTAGSKDFIGTTITGHGWRILFDAETSRTRVMFDAAPTDAARAAVENAGLLQGHEQLQQEAHLQGPPGRPGPVRGTADDLRLKGERHEQTGSI